MRRLVLASLPLLVAVTADCSDDGGNTGGNGGETTSATGSTTQTGSGGGFSTGTQMACQPGTPCTTPEQTPGVCTDNVACCPLASACGSVCCGGTEVCSFAQCVVPGIVCHDDKDCAAGEYCDFSLGEASEGGGGAGGGPSCPGGAPQPTGKCMPKPPVCPDGMEPGDPPTCVTSCEYIPPANVFTPELKYGWGDPASVTDNVMMSPVVIQLDDDNCDMIVDEKDIPEIVFFTFDNNDYNNGSGTSSTLHAISIVEGQVVEKFAVGTDGASADAPGRSIAAGDVDADGSNDIVVCTKDGRLRAYNVDGTIKWLSPARACFMPSIADLDQDGTPEVIDVGHVVSGADGTTKATFPTDQYVVVYDVDGDGLLDIVSGSRVYAADGTTKVDTALSSTHAAVGDLDFDGVPEIVSIHFQSHSVNVWHVDPNAPGGFEIIRSGMDLNEGISPNPCCIANPGNSGCLYGGGPPTVAHFNNDVYPDVGIAGGIGYIVFDGQKLMDTAVASAETRLWLTPTQDCSSAQTGSSVFDFDGNGVAEVVYADETTLHIYDGPTGMPLFETCNTNGTLWEYPLVADVDNDGHADIVVASNSYSGFNCGGTKTTGVRVFGDLEGKWVRTRRVWNQHPYMVTNVTESGAIPAAQLSNHLQDGLNNFRQNVQPSGQFSAPDLVVTLAPVCEGEYGLRARVLNIGEAPVEPGVVVGFYEGAPPSGASLGQAQTSLTLYPLTYEDVILPLATAPAGDVYAVVDDGMPPHPWHECRTDNNTSAVVDPACGIPQ